MSLGTNPIIKKSKINPAICKILINHPYYHTWEFEDQTHFIKNNMPANEFEEAILQFLKDENVEFSDKKIEYWFQGHSDGKSLKPHCDYNVHARLTPGFNPNEWMGTEKEEYFLSPITIAAYLEVTDDMEGGDLCISSRTWMDDSILSNDITFDYIKQFPYETHRPSENEVLYFHGSLYYHWIEPVTKGYRKSLLINFWPSDLGDFESGI